MDADAARIGAKPARRARRRRFITDRRGATAVEFALVSPVFFALLCAIIEAGMTFWAGQILETALTDASRTLYTGSFQTGRTGTNQQILQALRDDQLCKADGATRVTLFNCSDVKLEVSTPGQFPAGGPASPIDSNTGDWRSDFGTKYTKPEAGTIVVVHAAVKFPVFFSLLTLSKGNFGDGNRLLQAAVAFKTEPF